ncbi:uromodulin-like [Scyliorhinus canicula]|uniref:uromodulin-like n=1 Tax=Scyliorhinus canicula TaxID=7830 RepID=UPI0018F2AC2B|nr:uromodulin-like [Scyliorhinus canicula]
MRSLILLLGCLVMESTLTDPCGNYTVLEQPWRSTDCIEQGCSGQWMCDTDLGKAWYRLKSSGGWKIPENVVPRRRCSTDYPMWLNGSHPTVGEGEVTKTICIHANTECVQPLEINIKNCTEYIVYELKPPPHCQAAYCTDPGTANDHSTRESTDADSQSPTPSPKTDPGTANDHSTRESTDADSRSPTPSPKTDTQYKMIHMEVHSKRKVDDETAKGIVLKRLQQMTKEQCPGKSIDLNQVDVQCSDVDPDGNRLRNKQPGPDNY